MTVWELNRRAEGYRRNLKREWQQTASLMAAIMQPHSKKRIRPRDFMPKAFRHLAPKMDPERIRKDVNRKLDAYNRANGNDS